MEQHGFRLVVAVVCSDDACRAALAVTDFGAQLFEVVYRIFRFGLHAVPGRIHGR